MKRLTDAGFKYIPAAETNIKKTFARERARLKKLTEQPKASVTDLRKGAKK